MPLGYLCLTLHAHLPYVRHPEYDDFLEEDWLYEAITETYVPLLDVFDGLDRDGVDWRLTMSITPTLAGMLSDPLLQYRYVRHIDNLIALAVKEIERTRWEPEFNRLAHMYHGRFQRARDVFVKQYNNNLLHGFRRFFEAGKLELITCGATHGFLPLMAVNPNAVRAQIEIGCREFARHFGKRPQGLWLPECGYAPGVDELMRAAPHHHHRAHRAFGEIFAERLVVPAAAEMRQEASSVDRRGERARIAAGEFDQRRKQIGERHSAPDPARGNPRA